MTIPEQADIPAALYEVPAPEPCSDLSVGTLLEWLYSPQYTNGFFDFEAANHMTAAAKIIEAAALPLLVGVKREDVALWMMEHGYATGHGDTIENLLGELEAQAKERGIKDGRDEERAAGTDVSVFEESVASPNTGQPRAGWKYVYVKRWRTLIHVPESIADEVRDALSLAPAGIQRREDVARVLDLFEQLTDSAWTDLYALLERSSSKGFAAAWISKLKRLHAVLALPHTGQQEGWREVIEEIEWGATDIDVGGVEVNACPWCGGHSPAHEQKCKLAALLSPSPASPRAEGEWRDVPAHEIAMVLCAVDGHDPDTEAPITEMCDAANMPVPWWMVYVEYAEALLEKFKIHAPPVIADKQTETK